MKIFKKITIVSVLIIIMFTYIQTLAFATLAPAVESDLTLTPKPETNNIHLKWTGPQNSSYKVYQKKPGASNFETIGLTDFSAEAIDEEVKVLNIYPQESNADRRLWPGTDPAVVATIFKELPKVEVTYLDGTRETIEKSALLKVWMEGRYSKRRRKCN